MSLKNTKMGILLRSQKFSTSQCTGIDLFRYFEENLLLARSKILHCHIYGLVQNCSISIANVLEISQS